MKIRTYVATAILLTAAACAVNPATGRRELMLVSEAQEIAMGREADPQVVAMYGLIDDPALQTYVSDIGKRLAATSERPELPWTFRVVDDPTVNAFALPGGFIYVTRGILASFDSEAEMAGVLGHEIGHVTARHSASQMSRQQLQQIGLMGGMIFSERFREYGGLAMAGLQIMNLSYSRSDESESDRLGLRYISSMNYDPDAMIGVFQMLAQAGGGGEGRLPEWQLTHPYPENREADMRDIITESGMSRTGQVNRDRYLDRLDGMVFGKNPRQGYFVGTRFLHPEMAFELTYPTGWSTVNQTSAVAAVSPNEDAVVILGLVAGGAAPDAELRDFLRAEGITGGTIRQTESGGVTTARAPFQAVAESGTLGGEVAFLRYGGQSYRIVGYAAEADWARYSGAVGATIGSFAAVTDANVLNVQPLRLRITRVNEAISLTSFVQRNPQPVDIDVLARINRMAPGAVMSSGTRLKTVVGTPVGR